jgi:hypothetical protein
MYYVHETAFDFLLVTHYLEIAANQSYGTVFIRMNEPKVLREEGRKDMRKL